MKLMSKFRRKYSSSRLQPEYRFIRTLQSPYHVVLDKALGRYRISSKAFGPSKADKSLSGDLEQLLVEDGAEATTMYPAVHSAVGAAAIRIGDITKVGLITEHQPIESNWYHGGVLGIKKPHKQKLCDLAEEIVAIDQQLAAAFDNAVPKSDAGNKTE